MRRYMQSTFGFNPFPQFETMGKQNMAMFEQAVRMLNPFVPTPQGSPPADPSKPAWSITPAARPAEPPSPAPPNDARSTT